MNNEYDISKAFQRIEETLIKSMTSNLGRHLREELKEDMNWSAWQAEQLKSLEVYKIRNRKRLNKVFFNINTDIKDLLRKSRDDGKLQQEKDILEAIENGSFQSNDKKISKLWHIYKTNKNQRIKKKQISRIFDMVNQAESTFFKVDDKKLNSLIDETISNMKKAETSILRYANDRYRKIIFDAQVYANTGSGTPQQAVDMATHDFLQAGINNIEYANGARVNIKSYVEMAIRTANSRAHMQGEGQKRDAWGVHTVLVPNRGGGCPYCIKFQGKVFIDDVWARGTTEESNSTGYPLLSKAVKERLFHPNCKDTVVTYFPDINSEVTPPTQEQIQQKIVRYNKEQKLNYINRNIEKYKRLEMGSLDNENIEKYHNKRLEWQEYKKKFQANSNLSFYDLKQNKELDIPQIIDKTLKANNQTINKNAEEFINKNLTDNDIIQEKLDRGPFTYRKGVNKIVIDPNHEDISYYNIDESIIHEIIHMKDIRNNITNDNFEKLDKLLKSSRLYVKNNYSYFYDYLQKDRNNMSLCDIMSALSNGKLSGAFGHLPEYWKNDTIAINELSANLISSKIVENSGVNKLLEEIPPLKELAEECIKLWQV